MRILWRELIFTESDCNDSLSACALRPKIPSAARRTVLELAKAASVPWALSEGRVSAPLTSGCVDDNERMHG
jgi:hypothetical protein